MSQPLMQVIESLVHEPAAEYHANAGEYLSSHLLAKFRESPLLYQRTLAGDVDEVDRPAYLVGQAAHALTLEGRAAFERQFAVGGPINPKTGQVFGSNTKGVPGLGRCTGKAGVNQISGGDGRATEPLRLGTSRCRKVA